MDEAHPCPWENTSIPPVAQLLPLQKKTMCINNDDDSPILCVGYNTVSNPSLPPCPLTITTN